MDILEILNNTPKEELYIVDLEFFEAELLAGEYSADYIKQCREQISKLRHWLTGNETDQRDNGQSGNIKKKKSKNKGVMMGLGSIVPDGVESEVLSLTPTEIVFKDIKKMRQQDSYKTQFKRYVQDSSTITADFVDQNYSIFESWEIDAIISVKQMGEDFLERYFNALNHDKIARYQKFSEEFFIKHFAQLDAEVVLKYGKNPWRKKEKRSKHLDVFLRLKGVRI